MIAYSLRHVVVDHLVIQVSQYAPGSRVRACFRDLRPDALHILVAQMVAPHSTEIAAGNFCDTLHALITLETFTDLRLPDGLCMKTSMLDVGVMRVRCHLCAHVYSFSPCATAMQCVQRFTRVTLVIDGVKISIY